MEIRYNNHIAKRLKNRATIQRFYGKEFAEKIGFVLSVLQAADNLAMVPNVPPTRRHKLIGNYQDCWAIDVSKSYRLILRPVGSSIILEEIVEVIIEDIVDYH